jgi:hypothetical protein
VVGFGVRFRVVVGVEGLRQPTLGSLISINSFPLYTCRRQTLRGSCREHMYIGLF